MGGDEFSMSQSARKSVTVLILLLGMSGSSGEVRSPIDLRIAYDDSRAIDVGDLVVQLAKVSGVKIGKPSGSLTVPVVGVGGELSRRALGEILGDGARLAIEGKDLRISIDPRQFEPDRLPEWEARLRRLANHVESEARRRAKFGMHALNSYRPNDKDRPTICLVHGLNSSSGGFVHMIRPLEDAGFGLVVYDYPYNRDLSESCAQFARDWSAFRRRAGETRPWAILAHSMGALLARSYVEDPKDFSQDVSSLIMIAPVNQGSSLAKAQTLLQLLHGVQAVQGKKTTEALSHLGDGLGEAAKDMTPGSSFLAELNRRPRRGGVAYHILAGDSGLVTKATRKQVQSQIESLRNGKGLMAGLARAATADMEARLDEVSDGSGDGCVSVARTRLEGVRDHVTIHANHAELIRAPLLFADPGPVACMPYVLRWLGKSDPDPVLTPTREPAKSGGR